MQNSVVCWYVVECWLHNHKYVFSIDTIFRSDSAFYIGRFFCCCFTALVALGVFDSFEAKMCVSPRCLP